MLYFAEVHGMPSLLLSLGAEKVFDRIHWIYMAQVLEKCGFQGMVLLAFLALYFCLSAQVDTSSLLSRPFSFSNGTCQGCPYPPQSLIH